MFAASESALGPSFVRGVSLFNAGQWWEAHEAWEEVWHAATGDDRLFVQGLILLAAALHKRWQHGSLSARNYHKALAKWKSLPPQMYGLELLQVQQAVWEALHEAGQRPQLAPQ